MFNGKGSIEVLQHSHDVLSLAYRPDGAVRTACAYHVNGELGLGFHLLVGVLGMCSMRRQRVGCSDLGRTDLLLAASRGGVAGEDGAGGVGRGWGVLMAVARKVSAGASALGHLCLGLAY